MAAFEAAADPDAYPDSGEPWQPLKMYYFVSFHGAKFVALHEEMLRRGLESPYTKIFEEWADRAKERGDDWREPEITTQVPCGDYFEIRDQALIAHATQIDPNGFWFRCRSRCSEPRGRRRTIIWLGPSWIASCPRMTCSRASGRGCAFDVRRAGGRRRVLLGQQ